MLRFLFLVLAPWVGLGVAGGENITAVYAQDGSDSATEVTAIHLGLDGMWKVGHWCDVTMTLRSTPGFEGRVEVEAPDGEAAPVRYPATEIVRIAPESEVTLHRLVKIGRRDRDLTVLLTGEGIAERFAVPLSDHNGLPAQQGVLLQLGSAPALERADTQRKLRNLVVHSIAPPAFPDRWEPLESVQAIWISSGEGAANELSNSQVAAISKWVHMGGHLVFCAAKNAPSLLAPESSWSALAPGEFQGSELRRFGGGIEQFAGAQERLPEFLMAGMSPRGRNTQVLAAVSGADGEIAGLLRAPTGFGIVTFVGLDLEFAPFLEWETAPALVMQLLQRPGEKELGERRTVGTVRHVGYDDLSGQVRSALDSFAPMESAATPSEASSPAAGSPGVKLIAFSMVILILIVYTALLGPGDYFLLRRLQRFEWTWLTFPLLVAIVSVGLIYLRGTLKSDVTLLNQVDVVDVDVTSGFVRGTHWSQLYSPTTSHRSINALASPALSSLASPDHQPGLLLSWQGLPGIGLGAMDSTSSAGLLTEGYTIDLHEQAIHQLPMRNASSRSLSVRWWDQRAFQTGGDLTDEDGVLRGSLTLPLALDLEDCVLFYGTWAHLFDGGRLNAGETVLITDLLRRDLDWRLTQKRIAHQADTSYTTTPWDPEDRRLARIMEVAMFHNAAGGEQYTRLKHDYQGYLDLTTHLKMGRAVLVGRSRQPATELSVDNKVPPGERWSFYRVVYPVDGNERGGR